MSKLTVLALALLTIAPAPHRSQYLYTWAMETSDGHAPWAVFGGAPGA